MSDDKDERQQKGTELLNTLFGRHPDELPWPERLTDYTISHLFGDVWQRGSLDMQERSLVTCVALVALGKEAEQRAHFKGAKNLGLSRETLEDMIIHVTHYAGWPAGVSAIRVLNEVWPVDAKD
ncbi:MAG: carboxymuconolactone decarboxylase family protein [Pseudomonadota bacterium]